MKQRIGAMFSRVPGSVPALGAGAAIGGFVLDAWKRRQEEQDRARMVTRVIHSSFHAFQPKVEIPREQVQVTMKRLLDLDDRSPVLIWGSHLAGKSFALFKAFEQAGFREGVVHVKLADDKDVARELLCKQLGAPGHVEAEEALRQAAKTLSRLPIIVLEIPREVSDMAVVRSCSGFAKTWGYDAELAKVIVLASSASMALSFDADAREVRFQIQPLSEEECQQEEVQTFLKHHGGAVAVEHKSELLHLSGGNVGKLEDLAQALRTKTFEEVRLETISAQEEEILRFFGIDAQGGFGPEKVLAAKEVARRVADAPFEQCVRSVDFADRFTSKDLAQAVKARGAHCIYVKATTKADERFCAASPSVHALLKQKTRWLGIF
ncbi:unnamed protein product [Effrenium voratum]|uniref:Uncharacterized protein n=2 Tax=Effrenium voratum TaxID=2562239 RepID=A0AA36MUQ4_9DINO|nr:unnamed protein product [Effrenium voratum]